MAKRRNSEAEVASMFPFMNHGGRRKGAGRKAKKHADGSRVHPSHARREHFPRSRPLHVTVEIVPGLPSLRSLFVAPIVSDAIARANRHDDFRVVHVSIQSTHLHLICEAHGPEALTRGMRSLNGTFARAVNKRLARKGRVIAERYHVHVLRTPKEVRNAVEYVLRNGERHGAHDALPRGAAIPVPDPLSTAAWFPYWKEATFDLSPRQIPASVVRPAQCFLMTSAFRSELLSFAEPMRGDAKPNTAKRGRTTADSSRTKARPPRGPVPNRVPPPG